MDSYINNSHELVQKNVINPTLTSFKKINYQ